MHCDHVLLVTRLPLIDVFGISGHADFWRFFNLVPRVLSLPRESTLVAAGHVPLYRNQIRIGGGIIDLILSTLSMEVKVALRAAVYILKVKQVMFQRSFLTGASVLFI